MKELDGLRKYLDTIRSRPRGLTGIDAVIAAEKLDALVRVAECAEAVRPFLTVQARQGPVFGCHTCDGEESIGGGIAHEAECETAELDLALTALRSATRGTK